MMKSILFVLGLFVTACPMNAQSDVQPFSPELFETLPHVRDLAVSGDGGEIFFTVDAPKHQVGCIATAVRVHSEKGGTSWSEPEIVSFSGQYRDIEPFLSADGNRLYFASNRPAVPGSEEVKDYDIFYVEREGERQPWGEPVRLPEPINTEGDEYYPSVNRAGDLFFTSAREGAVGAEDIFRARWNGADYVEPVPVPGGLNTEGYEYNAFVDPDSRYIVFTSYRERDGRNRNDLYISFSNDDGSWGEAVLLPGIYSEAIDYCPFVHEASGKLYFTSERSELPDHFDQPLDLAMFLQAIRETPSGVSRIYTVDFDAVLQALKDSE